MNDIIIAFQDPGNVKASIAITLIILVWLGSLAAFRYIRTGSLPWKV